MPDLEGCRIKTLTWLSHTVHDKHNIHDDRCYCQEIQYGSEPGQLISTVILKTTEAQVGKVSNLYARSDLDVHVAS